MSDYWDPYTACAADEALIATVFKFGVSGVARALDQGSTKQDIPPDSSIESPLWLAEPLASRGMADVRPPKVYSERYRRKLNAGADVISLKGKALAFYDVGLRCNNILKDVELSTFLMSTFKTRYQQLLCRALKKMSGEDILELSGKLCQEEAEMFEAGRVSVAETDRWLKTIRVFCCDVPAQNKRRKGMLTAINGLPGTRTVT